MPVGVDDLAPVGRSEADGLDADDATPLDEHDGAAGADLLAVERVVGPDREHQRCSPSTKAFSFSRSLRFARRIAAAMNGAATFENPTGSPRLRRVIAASASTPDPRVGRLHRERAFGGAHHQPLPGDELDDLVGVLQPPPEEMGDEREPQPIGSGGEVFHSTDSMLAYHSGRWSGRCGKADTSPAAGR